MKTLIIALAIALATFVVGLGKSSANNSFVEKVKNNDVQYERINNENSEAIACESDLEIQSWMTNDSLWKFDESAPVSDEKVNDNPISIENWMFNDDYFKFDQAETTCKLRSWYTDETFWKL